jgi:tetratricopeptide (TPR) repeat protein
VNLAAVPQEVEEPLPGDLVRSEWLRIKGKLDDALLMCEGYMNEHFDDHRALVQAAHVLFDAERIGLSQALLRLVTMLKPQEAIGWNNLGLCYREGHELEAGEKCFLKALARDQKDAFAYNNLAQLYVNFGQPRRAIECADKAIALDPRLPDARYNKGQALLMLGEYKEGWEGYEYNLGRHKGRKERIYGTIPRWTGVNDLTVIAYGEQGIGDELSFASCIPDLMRSNKVIIECDKRLGNLFRRSFGVQCYGTRFTPGISWPMEHNIDAAVAFGSLPGFYRNSIEDFPGTPYLKADPERRLQWRALLDSLGKKPKAGIAWSGGLKNTGRDRRSVQWRELMPIFRQNATFVSLQYKGCPELSEMREAGIDIHHWAHSVESVDYDDTAALVAELDLVITVQQAAVHLAGGLGVPCWVLLPKAPLWRYGLTGSTMPWYKSVKLYRQRSEWVHPISEIATDLRALCLK